MVELLRAVVVSDCRGLLCVHFSASLATLSADLGCRWGDMGTRQFQVTAHRGGGILYRLGTFGDGGSGWLLENNGAALRGGLMWLVLGVALGALIGVALWWWRRPGEVEYIAQEEERADDDEAPRRREPVIG